MSTCRVFSCAVGRGCLLWLVCSLGKTLLDFALLHSVLQGQICLLLQVFLWRRQWHPTPVVLPGKSHGWRSLVGCSSLGSLRVGHDWATSLSCIGEGNGNPLQCSCLENHRDGGSWRAAVYGVAQSRTRLKRHSSSSSQVFLDSYFCIPVPYNEKNIFFGFTSRRSCRSS